MASRCDGVTLAGGRKKGEEKKGREDGLKGLGNGGGKEFWLSLLLLLSSLGNFGKFGGSLLLVLLQAVGGLWMRFCCRG